MNHKTNKKIIDWSCAKYFAYIKLVSYLLFIYSFKTLYQTPTMYSAPSLEFNAIERQKNSCNISW